MNVTETQRPRDDAKARTDRAAAELARLEKDLLEGDRATIAAARAKIDDARGEFNEAKLELETAERAHAAALKAERQTKLRIEHDAHNETRRLLEKNHGVAERIRQMTRELNASNAQILSNDAAHVAIINQLSAELGEPANVRPISYNQARALALSATDRNFGDEVVWLHGIADPELRAKQILALLGQVGMAVPAGFGAVEAATIALTDLDLAAVDRALLERGKAMEAAFTAKNKREESERVEKMHPVTRRYYETDKANIGKAHGLVPNEAR